MKIIGLDYDDTFSDNPVEWHRAMSNLKKAGYKIIGVTARNRKQRIDDPLFKDVCESIIYCCGTGKRDAVWLLMGQAVDIWIDDKPEYITQSYIGLKGVPWDISMTNEERRPFMEDCD